MTITLFEMYCLLKLDALQGSFIVTGVVTLMAFLITIPLMQGYLESTPRRFTRWMILQGAIAYVCFLTSAFIPSTKQAAIIFVLPKIINSDFVQNEVPAETRELYDLAKSWLKEAAIKNTGGK